MASGYERNNAAVENMEQEPTALACIEIRTHVNWQAGPKGGHLNSNQCNEDETYTPVINRYQRQLGDIQTFIEYSRGENIRLNICTGTPKGYLLNPFDKNVRM